MRQEIEISLKKYRSSSSEETERFQLVVLLERLAIVLCENFTKSFRDRCRFLELSSFRRLGKLQSSLKQNTVTCTTDCRRAKFEKKQENGGKTKQKAEEKWNGEREISMSTRSTRHYMYWPVFCFFRERRQQFYTSRKRKTLSKV